MTYVFKFSLVQLSTNFSDPGQIFCCLKFLSLCLKETKIKEIKLNWKVGTSLVRPGYDRNPKDTMTRVNDYNTKSNLEWSRSRKKLNRKNIKEMEKLWKRRKRIEKKKHLTKCHFDLLLTSQLMMTGYKIQMMACPEQSCPLHLLDWDEMNSMTKIIR